MEDGRLAVGGKADIELECFRPLLDGEVEGRESVFRGQPGRAPVPDDRVPGGIEEEVRGHFPGSR